MESTSGVTSRPPAAGQGFEPQLPVPETGVLPLDDPATAAELCRLDLESVHRHEALFLFGVDGLVALHVRLQARPAQLRLEQAVDLEDPGPVVHADLD